MTVRIRIPVLTLLCFALIACGSDSTGPEGGLVPGTYQASFTVPLSSQTPGGLIGDHEFTFPFRVGDPEDADSFQLLSSRHRSRTFDGEPTEWESGYLSTATDKVIATSTQWRVQWEYIVESTLDRWLCGFSVSASSLVPVWCQTPAVHPLRRSSRGMTSASSYRTSWRRFRSFCT